MDDNKDLVSPEITPEAADLSNTGAKVQKGVGVGIGILGILFKAGIVGATVTNPALAGLAIFSALLPGLFAKKVKAKAATLFGIGGSDLPGSLNVVGLFLLQVFAVLTAVGAWLDKLPGLGIIPEKYHPYLIFAGTVIAALAPALQRIGLLFTGSK